MTHEIIFESDDVVLHYNAGKTDFLLITFLGIGNENNAVNLYFGQPVCEQNNISCIGVTTKIRNWYYSPNMNKALEIIQSYIQKFSRTISFGLSAGAYAAIKYSARLKIDTTIALAPQLSIDDTETNVIEEWAALCTPEMRGMGIKAHDMFGDIFLFFDERHISDSATARTLQSYATSQKEAHIYGINVPNSGHIIYESIKGRKNILSMILTARSNSISAVEKQEIFQKNVRLFRKYNTANIYNKIMAGYARHPYLVYQLLKSRLFLDVANVEKILQCEPLFYKTVSSLHLFGYENEARNLLKAMLYYHTTGKFTLSECTTTESLSGKNLLIDHRGRTLGYSLLRKSFVSSNLVWMENDATIVYLITVNGIEYPAVFYLNEIFFLSKTHAGICLTSSPGNLSIERLKRQCAVKATDGSFLTIIDDLHHTWAGHTLLWELFYPISF